MDYKEYTVRIYFDGTKKWYTWIFDNRPSEVLERRTFALHREDGPAIEWHNGSKEWYKNGKRHREGGPAIEDSCGSKFWHKEGHLHRENGPAREYADGHKEWWSHGKFHREDGPAIEYVSGAKEWYLYGKKYADETEYKKQFTIKNSCDGKIVEIEGKKYKLTEI